MKVSPVCFDASTDEGIHFLVKTMEERGFEPQAVATGGTGIEEYTFWNVSDASHKVRFFLKHGRDCPSCTWCYSVTESKNDRAVLGTQSCQWLKNPKLVRIETLFDELSRAEQKVKACKEELKKLL